MVGIDRVHVMLLDQAIESGELQSLRGHVVGWDEEA